MKKRKYIMLYAEHNTMYAQIAKAAVAVVVLMSVMIIPAFRYGWLGIDSIAGRESYLYLRLAEDIKNMHFYDAYSYGGRYAAYEWGTPLVISPNPGLLSRVVPPITGILMALLFYLILKQFGVSNRLLCTAMLALSPPFIYLSNTLNKYAPALLLMMVSYYLIIKGRHVFLGALAAALVPLFSMALSLVFAFILALHYLWAQNAGTKFNAKVFLIASIFAFAFYSMFLMYYSGLPRFYDFGKGGFAAALNSIISDFGGLYGLGLFSIISATAGAASMWRKKYKRPAIFLSVFSLSIAVFFAKVAVIPLSLFVAYFSAEGIVHLFNKKWSSDTIRLFTLLILVCGILFSTVSYSKQIVNTEPGERIADAINALGKMPGGVAFSDYKNGYWISYARKVNIMDEGTLFSPDFAERKKDMIDLLNSRLMADALPIINKYNITYFWVDERMKKEWWNGRDEQGLQFLLKYGSDFKEVYRNNDVEIWKISQRAYADYYD